MSRRIVTIGRRLGVSGYRRRMIKAHTTHRRQFADKADDHGQGLDVGGLAIKKATACRCCEAIFYDLAPWRLAPLSFRR
jgi:hypothetical protein